MGPMAHRRRLPSTMARAGAAVMGGQTTMHFSPCGSLLLVLVHAIHTGVLMFNMRDIKNEGERTHVQTQFFRVSPSGMPAVAHWDNGLWMETHDMNSVMEIGQNIVFLKDGQVAWQGNASNAECATKRRHSVWHPSDWHPIGNRVSSKCHHIVIRVASDPHWIGVKLASDWRLMGI